MNIIICALLPVLESTESVRGLEGGHSRVHQPGPGASTLPSGKLTFLLLDAMSPVLHVEGSRTRLGSVVIGRCCSGWYILVSNVAFHLRLDHCPFVKAFLLLLLSYHLHIFCYTVTLHLVGGLLFTLQGREDLDGL
jgi:hypothetical protein